MLEEFDPEVLMGKPVIREIRLSVDFIRRLFAAKMARTARDG